MDCKDCGMTPGTNKDCTSCLQFLVDQGTRDFEERDAERAADDGNAWLEKKGLSAPGTLVRQVKLLVRVIGDYLKGDYAEVPWATLASVGFAILYVVNPIDLIPDFIPVLGFVDDAAIVGLILKAVQSDLLSYCHLRGIDPSDYDLR